MIKKQSFISLLVVLLVTGVFVLPAMAFPGEGAPTPDPPPPCGDNRTAGTLCREMGLSGTELRAANAMARSFPRPNVIQVQPDATELSRYQYMRVVDGPVKIYNAPNGQVARTLDEGFHFVTAQNYVDGWYEINWNEWVHERHLELVRPSEYSGVMIPEKPLMPFAWVLVPTVPSSRPGGEPHPTYERVERYTLINIYASEYVDGWRWYLIGPDRWIIQTQIAKVLPIAKPEEITSHRWVAVDLYEQVTIAYEGERMVFATLISSGMPDWPTHEGVYTVWHRTREGKMSGAEGQVDFYFLENVPWTLYFDGDISFHGTYWHDGFGYRHSHGCVNMSITDSHWLFDWAEAEPDFGVYVFSTGQYKDNPPR